MSVWNNGNLMSWITPGIESQILSSISYHTNNFGYFVIELARRGRIANMNVMFITQACNVAQ